MRKGGIVRGALAAACLAVFAFSAYEFFPEYMEQKAADEAFGELSAAMGLAEAEAGDAEAQDDGRKGPGISPVLPQYEALHEQNPDLFGWISIEGTKVDYPVMHTPDEPGKYLHADFNGKYSGSGTPFLDEECSYGCGNYIIYAHHMKSGSMFGQLPKYADRKFWEEHKTVRFDTLWDTGEYEAIAAFYADASEGSGFKYWEYADLNDEARFDEFVEGVRRSALYDTGITVEYGDQLITLSTCSYHTEDGRFVVVAKRAR